MITVPIHRQSNSDASARVGPQPVDLIGIGLRAVDLLVVAATSSIAGLITGQGLLDQKTPLLLITVLLVAFIAFSASDLYDVGKIVRRRSLFIGRLAAAWLGTIAVLLSSIALIYPDALPPRDWVLTWAASGLIILVGTRLAVGAWVERLWRTGQLGRQVIVVGSGAWGGDVRDRLDMERHDARVLGYLDLEKLGDAADRESVLRQLLTGKRDLDLVALALDARDMHRVPELLRILRDFPVEVGLLPQLAGANVPTLGYSRIGALTSVTCLKKPIDGLSWHLKSAFDRVAAFFLLLFLAPLLAMIAIAVKWTSNGPVFFRQTRLGFNQQPINVFKFRSMYTDRCDTALSSEVKHATRDDPRVTPLGAVLRRTSLDELPQLFNVLRGEMSLVGPRPHAVAHDEYYASLIDGYLGRHRAKPGITGWAQVNGERGEIAALEDMRRRIELDLYYIDNWSLWLDLKILLRTVAVCFNDERAY